MARLPVRYDGTTGALLGTFIAAGSGGLSAALGITFDPSGQYLYVASSGGPHEVLKYNAQTGAYVGLATSGMSRPADVKFGADGLLYVLDDNNTNRIARFTESGAYVDDYVPVGSGGISNSAYITFGPNNGDLYTGGGGTNQIHQFGTENEALFTVTLSAPFAEPVTVSYATADGTALAGTNYTATSGTLTFPAGITTKTIRVPLLDSGSQTTALTFTVTLSNPQLATISQSQGTGTIAPSDQAAKFYVVNDATSSLGGTNTDYKYQPSGTQQAPYALSLNDLAPRGVASNATGTTQWVVDANKNVYVYCPGGTLLGSWSAGGLSSSAQLTGIATDGTNIWLVDSYSAKVYKYTGAASLLSGSQNAASSFSLASGRNGNSNPQDLVTDGTSIWVVDVTALKVFKYTLSGSLLGSWSIDPANTHPTGITINPTNVSDIWIVDNGTDKVYQYIGAASRTSGSQNAGATFALAAGDTNPQGIAEPPATVSFASAMQTVVDNAGTFSVTVNLSTASNVPTTIPFTLGGTAVNGVNYSNVTGNLLVIPAGQTSGTIMGTLMSGSTGSEGKTLNITLGTPTNAALGTTTTEILNIREALPAPKISNLNLLEGTSGVTPFSFRVSLPAPSRTPVTYDVYTASGSALDGTNFVGIAAGVNGSQSLGTVTFAAGQIWQTVTVYVIAGSLPVTKATATATFTINLSDPGSSDVPLASGKGTIIAQEGESGGTTAALDSIFAAMGTKKNTPVW